MLDQFVEGFGMALRVDTFVLMALGLFGGMPAGAAMMGIVVAALGPRESVLIPMIGLALVLAVISIFTPILSVRRKS